LTEITRRDKNATVSKLLENKEKLLIFCTLLSSALAWGPPFSNQNAGRIAETLMSATRGNDFVVLNFLPFGENLPELFIQAAKLSESLGVESSELSASSDTRLHAIEYLLGEERSFQIREERVQDFRENIFLALELFQLTTLNGSVSDLVQLSNILKPLHYSKKEFKSLFWLFPFLYNEEGRALSLQFDGALKLEIKRKVQSMNSGELQALYVRPHATHYRYATRLSSVFDILFKEETRNEFRTELISQMLNDFEEDMIVRQLPLFAYFYRPHEDKGGKRPGFFALEEISPMEALLRGELAGDCSTSDLAFYALLGKVKVFKTSVDTKNSKSQRLKGFVFVLEIEQDGKTIPYIVSMNSRMAKSLHAELAVQAIARAYGTQDVLLPNFTINPLRPGDNPEIQKGFDRYPGELVTEVDMGAGWHSLDAFYADKITGHSNQYSFQLLRNARVVSVAAQIESEEFRIINAASYTVPQETGVFRGLQHSPFVRSLLAMQHAETAGLTFLETAQLYSVTEDQVSAANYLLRTGDMEAQKILKAFASLEFQADFLKFLPVKTQLEILKDLHLADADLLRTASWTKAAEGTLKHIEKNQIDMGTDFDSDHTKKCLAALRGK